MIQTANPQIEGAVLNAIMGRRVFNFNKNFLCVVTGATGSGKSMCDLRIAELWYKYKFKKQFPIEHCCFGLDEMLGLLASGKLVKGDLLILEEAGVSMGALDFQNKISKMFNYVLQTFRSKNIILLVNLPHFVMLNKTMRMLMHCKMEMQSIDFSRKLSYVKPLFIETNSKTGKLWYQYPKLLVDGTWEKIKVFSYSLPSEELTIAYEKKKDDFVNGVTRRVLKEIDMANAKTDKELGLPKLKSELQKLIWKTLTENPNKYNQTELTNLLGLKSVGSVGRTFDLLEKKGYNPRIYLRKQGFQPKKVINPSLVIKRDGLQKIVI